MLRTSASCVFAILVLFASYAIAEEPVKEADIKLLKQRLVGKWEQELVYDESYLGRVFRRKPITTFLSKVEDAYHEVGKGRSGVKWLLELSEDGKFKLSGELKMADEPKPRIVSVSGDWRLFSGTSDRQSFQLFGVGKIGDDPWECNVFDIPITFAGADAFSGPCFWGEADECRWVFTRVK